MPEKAGELKAAQTVRGVAAELDATFPLLPDETVQSKGMVAVLRGRLARQPCYVRLTNRRLCLVEHFAFRADVATAVPPEAVRAVALEGQAVAVCWEREDGTEWTATFVDRLRYFSGPALGGRLPDSPSQFAERLTRWSAGPQT